MTAGDRPTRQIDRDGEVTIRQISCVFLKKYFHNMALEERYIHLIDYGSFQIQILSEHTNHILIADDILIVFITLSEPWSHISNLSSIVVFIVVLRN